MRLTYRGLSYWDRTLPIEQGTVTVPGLDLEFEVVERPGDLFRRQAQDAEFAASEMSLSTYLMVRARGDDRLLGVPIFPSRNFRHRDVYLRPGLEIDDPRSLRGMRLGVPEYQMTAALWIRGLLEDEYDLRPDDVTWCVGGLRDASYEPRLTHDPPRGVRIDRIPRGRWLEEMLASGDIDALVTVTPPPTLGSTVDAVHRLFPDYVSQERAFHGRTGIFPIMHLVVCRSAEVAREPQLPRLLYDLFDRSRQVALERLRYLSCLAVGLPWLPDHLADIEATFDGDPFASGIAANATSIGAAMDYAVRQGLVDRTLRLDEIFAPQLLDT